MGALAGFAAKIIADGTDVSFAFREGNGERSADTVDSTNFGGNGWKGKTPGLRDAKVSLQGLFDSDVTATGVDAILAALAGVEAGTVFTFAPAGWIEGTAVIAGAATQASSDIKAVIGDIVSTSLELDIANYGGAGRLLRVALDANDTVGAKTAYDNGAETSNGGTLVVNRTSGSTTGFDIRVEHSADNVSWATIATYTSQANSGVLAANTSLIQRYLRVNVLNAGTSNNRYVASFVRG